MPLIEHWGTRYVVDTKLGHFRRLSSPFEVIEFESEWGKGMGGVVGVMYSSYRVGVMHRGVTVGVCWVREGGWGGGANLSDPLRW